jgi:glycosyltransferase involved in cell wall biosynthesis
MQMASTLGSCGAVIHCRALCDALAARGYDVTLVCEPASWIASAVSSQVRVELSDLHRFPLDEVRRIGAIARAREIDVVQTHLSAAHFFGFLLGRATGVPVLATAHALRLQLHWAVSDRVIAVSETCATFQRRWNRVRSSRLRVIPGFVDGGRFAFAGAGERAAARARLGIDAPFVMGIVGSLGRIKRTAVALDACGRVLARRPDAAIVVAGSGPAHEVTRLRRRAARIGVEPRTHWLGWRDELERVLPAIDVLVTASRDEAVSLASAEAMACGVPVASSPCDAVEELIGETGTVARSARAADLADSVLRLAADDLRREDLGRAAAERIRERYTLERHLSLLEENYAEAITLRRRSPLSAVRGVAMDDAPRTTRASSNR